MQFKGILYLLFCVLCGAKPPGGPQDGLSGRRHHNLPGGPQDGLSGSPQYPQPGGPQDGLPGAEDDDPLSSSSDNDEHLDHRPVPIHSFEKRVLTSKVSVENDTEASADISSKKVFVKLIQGPFTFKKRKEKCGRVTFTCNGCQKFKHFLSVLAWVERVDDDPENDVYTLDAETLPASSDHVCVTSGIEDLVKKFREDLENQAKHEPTQAFPTLDQSVR